jgi:hypothetical protein
VTLSPIIALAMPRIALGRVRQCVLAVSRCQSPNATAASADSARGNAAYTQRTPFWRASATDNSEIGRRAEGGRVLPSAFSMVGPR